MAIRPPFLLRPLFLFRPFGGHGAIAIDGAIAIAPYDDDLYNHVNVVGHYGTGERNHS
jgi:hypothetical protein